jgi:protein-tyrosine kinase
MSKIYEALLRAELERTVSHGEKTPEAAAARAVQTLLNPEIPEVLPLDQDPLGPTYVEPTPEPSNEAIGEMLEPVDFSSIGKFPWQPLMPYLPALEDRGPNVEQFRSLRSHIFEVRDARPLKSVVVSSGLPGEGKSFITANLALTFSRHKANRVLLVDGDMRRSSLHKLLGTKREPGLSDYLAGEKSLLEVMQRCDTTNRATPVHQGIASLTFIPGGRDAENAGDLAAHPRFAELISTAGSWFDWIFVDSSPVNLVADAATLSRSCNGVLLVAREGNTKFKTAQQAQAQFKTTPVLGFVLNAVPKLPVKGDYYGGYDAYKTEA